MVTRDLPRAEWPRLAGTEVETIWPHLPESAHVLVVEDAGNIVGTWLISPVFHVECVWIAEAHRKQASVARRLLVGMKRLAASLGTRRVMTAAVSDDVRRILASLQATPVPGDHYVINFE